MRRARWWAALAVAVVAAASLAVAGCGDDDDGGDAASTTTTEATSGAQGLLASAVALDEDAGTITLPLFRGVGPDGGDVYYVVTESSDAADAQERGVTHAPRLANALGTKAVQKVTVDGDTVTFAGTVDFAPERAVTPGPDGFPPKAVTPGAVGDARYSPLITPDGEIVLNASQVMNASGTHDAVTDIDTAAGTVTLKTLHGFFDGATVAYLRLDASVDVVAALEESVLAPNLNAAPGEGSNAAGSSRSAIVPIVNGTRGVDDPNRQGLQSAVLGEGEPLNVTQSLPGADDYSPLWDVTPALWSEMAIADGRRTLLTRTDEVTSAVEAGDLASAGEGPANSSLGGLRALGAVSNCPTVAIVAQ
jgi:hypothetical protein